MNPFFINLLEKEGYSQFGALVDEISSNTLGMCFIKDNKIYFYKECGNEIAYEELFEYRKSDFIVLEYSSVEKRYFLSSDFVYKECNQSWTYKVVYSYVVNIKKGIFTTLREDRISRFPREIEYFKDSLVVYSSSAHNGNIDSTTYVISKSQGDLYFLKENDESHVESATFYCKWNGWCVVDSKKHYTEDVHVSKKDNILYMPKDSLLWKVAKSENIWVITNIVNKSKGISGFYAISLATQVFCSLYEHCIPWYSISVSSSHNSLWIHSNNELLKISEYIKNGSEYYCEISNRAKIQEHYHNLVVLSEDYAVFKHELGPIYYVYDLNASWNLYHGYVDPTYEAAEEYNSHYVRIGSGLEGLLSLKTGKIVIPQIYNYIRFWEADGKVYSIVGIKSKNIKDSQQTCYEGLYVDDCILIPPFCKEIARVAVYDSNYNLDYQKYAGFVEYLGFNDSLGLCYRDEILESKNIIEISKFKPGYMLVVKNDESILYHHGNKLFSAKCKDIQLFSSDLLLMVGNDNQCGLISYDGDIKLPMGIHDLSYKSYNDGKEYTLLIIDKERNVYDSRDMRPLVPISLHFQDALIRYNKSDHRNILCLACYEENQELPVFIDIDGNKLESIVAFFEPIGEVLVVINKININDPIVDEEAITYKSEKEYEYDVFDLNLKKLITNDVYDQGYEIIKENSQILIRKKEIEEHDYDEDEKNNLPLFV